MLRQPTPLTNAWDFVERYYPNYSTSGDIAYANDLQKAVDDEWEEGDDAHEISLKLGNKEAIQAEYDRVHKEIYEEAMENFFKKHTVDLNDNVEKERVVQGDDESKEISRISAIISDQFNDKICKLLNSGYIACLDNIADWAHEFYLEHINANWEDMLNSEKALHQACWDDYVVAWAALKVKELDV